MQKSSNYAGKQLQAIRGGFSNNKVTIPLHGLPSGLFIMTIHTQKDIAVKRFVKR